MKKYKAVLFDYDGTIIDTNEYIINSWQYMASKVMGNRRFDIDYLIKSFGTPLEDAILIAAKDYGIEGYTVDELCAFYREYQQKNPDLLGPVCPGVADAIRRLKEGGALLGIVTSRRNKDTKRGLERYDLLRYFDVVVGEDDTEIHKPLPEPALICCEKLGVDPSDAVMIGDSRYDIECGNNAGADTVFVGWSFCTRVEDLSGISKPTYFVKDAEELVDIVL